MSSEQEDNFIEDYMKYVKDTEPPYVYHRWVAISAIGALLGRNYFIEFGHGKIFGNMYIMLLGESGTRKSSAIKMIKPILSAVGYNNFSARRSSREQFLSDLNGFSLDDEAITPGAKRKYDAVTADNLWGEDDTANREPKEVFIMADEFNEFAGSTNLVDFYSTLGDLWDWNDTDNNYTNRFRGGKSISVFQPTISILGGNTADNFSRAFPPEIIGQGFFSRILIIYGERSARRFTIPPVPDSKQTEELIKKATLIRNRNPIPLTVSTEAFKLLDTIYKGWQALNDVRFKSYSERRFTQLLKLSIISCAGRLSGEISYSDIIYANTILTASEHNMPRAIGEFGKAKNSDVAQKIIEQLEKTNKPLNIKDLWIHVHKDLNKASDLSELMSGLQQADKVQFVTGKGFLPKKLVAKEDLFVNWSLLTQEERDIL